MPAMGLHFFGASGVFGVDKFTAVELVVVAASVVASVLLIAVATIKRH